ncbi:MAG TPA: glutathione-independent formaldehyde dehydrogenase [Streptosporangiaceae bacterium]|jgi:threonine dehydrogenase-like Zn-dependent dehydrogenase
MKAVVYHGPRNVSVDDVPDARIEKPTDALVRITSTNICGSDLHMYEGRTDFEQGRIFGHENVGEVIEVGNAVEKIKVGDMISAPFNVSCGHCENCEHGLTNYCLVANPDPKIAGAAYGFADMGPWPGGQAELLRVPWADFDALRLPEDARERQDDYVMLSDIFPTGWHAVEMSGMLPGETIVIYGGGPVGQMAALSAVTKGAAKVMVVDRHPDRLKLAEQIGAMTIDDSKANPVEAVMEETKGLGADRGCECVGYQAHDPEGHENNSLTLNDLVESVRFTGGIGTVGVYVPQDPGAPDDLSRQGRARFEFGNFWFKGQHMGTGQCPVKRYNRHLRNLIAQNKVKPSWIVSHDLPLAQAPEAYKHFDAREQGWTKVVLHPGQAG